jgi:hypothetical protein
MTRYVGGRPAVSLRVRLCKCFRKYVEGNVSLDSLYICSRVTIRRLQLHCCISSYNNVKAPTLGATYTCVLWTLYDIGRYHYLLCLC